MRSEKNFKRILWSRNIISDVDLFAKSEAEILPQLTKLGYEIYFISGYSKFKYRSKDSRIHPVPIPVGEKNLPFKYHFIFTLVQLFIFPFYILATKPNYIIVDWDSVFGLIPMIPFCRSLHVKVILDIRSTPTPIEDSRREISLRSNLLDSVFNVSVSIAKRKLDGITIITNLMKKEICSKFDINPAIVGVWPSGVSSDLFFDEKLFQSGTELRKKLGLTKKFIVFYHGSLSESRGLIEVINSMVILKDKHPEIVLFLLGKNGKDLKEIVSEKSVEDSVIFHDFVDHSEVPKYIAMCDVGIVPLLVLSQWMNQCPLKLIEYLSMKKTIILTEIPCHREIIGNDKCGIFLSSTSPAMIAKSISFAFDNKEKLKEWGARGREIVADKYTWERVASNLDDYLKGLEKQ